MEITVSLIRSGLTQYDLEGRYVGMADEPLSAEGILMLQQKKDAGQLPASDYIYTASARRCLQTASILFPSQPAVVVSGFVPYHYGSFEGKTYAEIEQDPAFERWALDQDDLVDNQAIYAVTYRNIAAFRGIMAECVERDATKIAIVTHRLSILAIIRNYCIPRPIYREITLDPGGCITILYHNYRDSAKIVTFY